MLAGVGHGQADLPAELLHCSLAVGQDVDDLGAAATGQRGGHTGELVEELDLGGSVRHLSRIMAASTSFVSY